jgi:thymidylate synthase (FAD)
MSDETVTLDAAKYARQDFLSIVYLVKDRVTKFRDYYSLTRELAQRLYPQNRYTVCRASANLWNWMHFLNLRCKPDAQFEIRQYANEIRKMLTALFPVAMEAWEEHIFNAVTLSRTEQKQIQDWILKEHANESVTPECMTHILHNHWSV